MISIAKIMSKEITTVNMDTPIYEALDLLTKKKISGMPVVNEDDDVVGILTEKDVLKILIDKNLNIKDTVKDYMTRDVICFSEEDNAIEICKFFIRSHIRRVPIVNDGKLVGIVSRRDILTVIQEAKSKIDSYRYA